MGGSCENKNSIIKIQLFSNTDFFFMYEHEMDFKTFEGIIKNQINNNQPVYKFEYREYLTMLIKLFNNSLTNPKNYLCQLIMHKNNSATLYFKHIMEFKAIDLLQAEFEVQDEDVVKPHIKYRHKLARA
mmetsp:Transcript_17024/g.12081  ORF Transcript_17024/g.12081 Transcript_17024/m.12081 type:complete len:129 (-) Transcript_17024:226-612(-)